MLPVIAVFLISAQLVAASENATIASAEQQKQPLCDIGCKCPPKGQSLMFLDCSRLGLSSLPSSLSVESSVTSFSFQANHLEFVVMGTFARVDPVQELDLSLNLIKKIDSYTFTPFMSLTSLRLSHNRLTELSPGLLEGLYNLRVLEMSHNIIQSLSYLSFETTQKLQELRLQYNPIFDLPENIFRYLPNLEKLDLQDTGLVMLPDDVFRPTPRLHWLSLANNAFENVPEEALSNAHHLENLNLSENDFTVLAEGSFRRLSNISVLYLNKMTSLTRIEKDAFVGLTKLKSFFCSYNPKLSYIDEEAFGSDDSNSSLNSRAPPIQQLHLRQNALRTLKSPLELALWSSVSFVDLEENPWKCDCNLLWMLQLGRETQASVKCESPRQLHGRTFNTIDPSELRCEGTWAIATFALVIACMVAFGAVMLAVASVVCSRTPVGLFVRAKQQFSYAKVKPKTEVVDLEWDHSADSF